MLFAVPPCFFRIPIKHHDLAYVQLCTLSSSFCPTANGQAYFGPTVLTGFATPADKAAEGWFFDARDRRGVLPVKTKALPLAAGFTVRVGL